MPNISQKTMNKVAVWGPSSDEVVKHSNIRSQQIVWLLENASEGNLLELLAIA